MTKSRGINPFHAGTYSGVSTYYTDAESRIDRVRAFTRAQCEAALKIEGLQKSVQAAVRRRLRQIADVAITITFADHGQDFLEWDLDVGGKVVGCRPFQASIWRGRQVMNHLDLREGHFVILEGTKSVKYPLIKVVTHKPRRK